MTNSLAITSGTPFTGLPNALILPNIPTPLRQGLLGAYWLTSGDADKCKIDHSGNGNHLTEIGSPTYRNGRVVVGAGNGFDTGLTETANLTYLIVAAREDVVNDTAANAIIFIGNQNNDPAVNNYGVHLWVLDSAPAVNDVMTYRARGYRNDGAGAFPDVILNPGGSSNEDTYNRTFANGVLFECWGVTVGGETLAAYQPRVQEAAALTSTQTAPAGWSNRRLQTDTGAPIKVLLGTVDDISKGNFNGAMAAAFIWNRALTAAEVTAMYNAVKSQLQGLSVDYEFPARYAGL